MTEHKKKNRTREQIATQLISDPELGQVLTLATPNAHALEEDTTPEPHHTTPMDAEEILARLHGPVEHATTELSSLELDAVLKSSTTPRSETLSLHRLPRDLEEAMDHARHKQEIQHTQRWSKQSVDRLVEEASARTHQTEQLSNAALGHLLAGEERMVKVSSDVIKEVETVRWDKDSPIAKIVSEHEAAALLEISGAREDDEALRDVPEKHRTEQVSQEDLDRVLELATKTRPRQGRQAHDILEIKPEAQALPARSVAQLEEKMPAIRKAPTGHYKSMIAEESSSKDSAQTLLLVGLVLLGLGLVTMMLVHMWPG